MENYDPIEEQYAKIQSSKKNDIKNKRKVEFDVKNYLDTRVSGKETEKKITIRIINLTPESKTPFVSIHQHYLAAEKKSFVCNKQTEDLPEGTPRTCPFCDIREEAKEAQQGATPQEWERLKKIYKENGSNVNYVVRVIDRSNEEFGVKFWKFSEKVYKYILELYRDNKADDINIFDTKTGKDLVVTVTKKDNKTEISSITAKNKQTPLSDSEDNINKWVTDEKLWYDVYGIKSYEYLELLIEGKEPYFDKVENKWIAKKKKEEDSEDDSEETEDSYHEVSTEKEEETEDLPF